MQDRSGRIKVFTIPIITDAVTSGATITKDLGGEILKIRATCCATGAVVTIQTLEQEGNVLISGDTLMNKIVTNTTTVRPVFAPTGVDGVAASGAGVVMIPNVTSLIKVTIATGGSAKPNYINIYVR